MKPLSKRTQSVLNAIASDALFAAAKAGTLHAIRGVTAQMLAGIRDRNGSTPLHYATDLHLINGANAEFLLGVKRLDRLDSLSPLSCTAEPHLIPGITAELLAADRDLAGATLFHYDAVEVLYDDDDDVVPISLVPGVNAEFLSKLTDNQGKTPLHYALEYGPDTLNHIPGITVDILHRLGLLAKAMRTESIGLAADLRANGARYNQLCEVRTILLDAFSNQDDNTHENIAAALDGEFESGCASAYIYAHPDEFPDLAHLL